MAATELDWWTGTRGDPRGRHLRVLRPARVHLRPLVRRPRAPDRRPDAARRHDPAGRHAAALRPPADLAGAARDRHVHRALAVRGARADRRLASSPRARWWPRSSASPRARRSPTSSPGSCSRSPSRCASATGSPFEEHYGVVEDVRLNFTILRTLSEQRIVIPNERLASGILRNDTLETDAVGLDVSLWLPAGADVPRALDVLREETGQSVSVAEAARRGHAPRGRRRARAAARTRQARGGAARAVPAAAARGRPARRAERRNPSCTREGYRAAPAKGRTASTLEGPPPPRAAGLPMSRSQRTTAPPLAIAAAAATRPSSACWSWSMVVGIGGHRRRRLRRLDRRLRPVAVLAEGARPGLQLRGAGRRRLAAGLHPGLRAAPARRGQRVPEAAQGRHGRDRGPPLLPARRHRLRGRHPRRRAEPRQPEDRAGRLDDHDAARPQPLHLQRAHVPAQDPRGQGRAGDRGAALQAVDPRQVPQHGALRHGGRAVGDRRQGRRADLLQQAPGPADAARGRDARRPAAGAVAVLAAAQPGRRQGAPQRRPARDGALGDDHRADRRRRRCGAASGSTPRPTSRAAARATSSTTSRTS